MPIQVGRPPQASGTRAVILSILHRSKAKKAPLSELARALGISPPAVWRHLRILESEGYVERVATTQANVPAYRLVPQSVGIWYDPTRGVYRSWSTHGEFNLRFPLVSRIPDLPAQRVLLNFLKQAEAKGLLHPFLVPKARTKEGTTVIVFGSIARGDSRRSSDIDLLVIQPAGLDLRREFRDLAAESNLGAERKFDLRVVSRDSFSEDTTQELRDSIQREGITVFSSHLDGEVIEQGWEPAQEPLHGHR